MARGSLAHRPGPRPALRGQLPERCGGPLGFERLGSRAVPPRGGTARTLVLHWDGRRWAIIASPNAGPGDNSLVSVAAASARDVWAVGYRDAGSVGQGPRPIPAAGPAAQWAELVYCPRAREASQRHAERGRRLGQQGGMGCWRHEERWWGPCLRPSDRWLELARRPDRPRGRAERRPQRHLGGSPGRCVGGRKLVRRPLVPPAGRARPRRLEDVERADPRHPRLRRSSDGRGRPRRRGAVGGRERLTGRRSPACPDPAPLRQLALLTTGGHHPMATGASWSPTPVSSASTRIASAGR